MSHLASVSDMSVQQFLEIQKQDEDGLAQLLCYGIQLHPSLKLAKECAVKEFWGYMLKQRSKECGSRLQKRREAGGVAGSSLDWSKGCYVLECDSAGHLEIIVNPASGERIVIEDSFKVITRAWTLMSNWSDFDASVQMKPMPPIKLASFFAEKSGPHRLKHFGCKTTEFAKYISMHFELWDKDRQSRLVSDETMLVAKEGLSEIRNSKYDESLKMAREKAAQRTKAKRARNAVSLAQPKTKA